MALFSKKTTTSIDPVQKELIENAQARVRQKKNLYRHFVAFLAGAILLIVINQVLNVGEEFKPFETPWFVWAILIWTFFFLIHLINVIVMSKFMNKEWEQKHLDRLVAKQKLRIAELEEGVQVSHPLPEKKSPISTDPNTSLDNQNTPPMITMIAAAAENNALGKNGDIPWHLPDDFRHFKKLTTGHHIIMGRKTWESFPKPLPNRTHVVITRDKQYNAPGATVVHSLEDALAYCKQEAHTFIIGGGEIYKLGMPYATHIELTRVHNEYAADAFFPEIPESEWELVNSTFHDVDDKHKSGFTFQSWKRK